MGDKDLVTSDGIIPHGNPLCDIMGPPMITRTSRKRINLGLKELGKYFDQQDHVGSKMKKFQ